VAAALRRRRHHNPRDRDRVRFGRSRSRPFTRAVGARVRCTSRLHRALSHARRLNGYPRDPRSAPS
jgi:hypothetical protein